MEEEAKKNCAQGTPGHSANPFVKTAAPSAPDLAEVRARRRVSALATTTTNDANHA
jgi:hypothetical protein